MRAAGIGVGLLAVLTAGCDDYIYEPGGSDGTVDGANWSSVKVFFENECNACHAGTEPILPDAVQADIESGAGALVVAGSPDDSVLWRVIAGQLQEEDYDVMPLGTGPLPSEETAFIQEWITAGASLEESTTGTTDTDTELPTYSANWVGITELLHDKCSACHSSGGLADPVLPTDLEQDLTNATGLLVVPGSLEDSLLWRVTSGNLDAGDAGVMPQGTGPLDDALLAVIEEWILDGASLN